MARTGASMKTTRYFSLLAFLLLALPGLAFAPLAYPIRHFSPVAAPLPAPRLQTDICQGEFIPVSTPLNDLGASEYIRLETGPTGFTGGLYPDGSNVPPPEHAAAGLAQAAQIVPRAADGTPDPNGKIVLISVGMSNTASEFGTFDHDARGDSSLNPHLVIVNGAQGGRVATFWTDPQADAWQFVDDLIAHRGATPQQVQAAWVKLTNYDLDQFPASAQKLQADLEMVARSLHVRYPNLKIAYFSSRTRAYAYWEGANPEPGAFETGFAVKWLIEKQINGDLGLNFDPANGDVVAPFLMWGPYLWIDGLNPRSDGLIWTQADLKEDCVHPTIRNGRPKVAAQLDSFFRTNQTSRNWFLADPSSTPTPTPAPTLPPASPTPRPTYVPWVTSPYRIYIAR